MNTKNLLMVGGLLALGGFAYYMLTKPRKNSDGFFSADGTKSSTSSSPCRVCEGGAFGSLYYSTNGSCRRGDKCRQTIRQYQMGE